VGSSCAEAAAVGHHHGFIVATGDQLVVGVDLVILMGPVEVALGAIDARLHERGAQVFEAETVGRERSRIRLDADGRFLSAADAHQADSAQLRELRGKPRVYQIFDR